MSETAQQAIAKFKTFLGKPREDLPWLNGKTPGFPNRVKGFYDCALGYSFIAGIHPAQVSCHAIRDLCLANKTWHTDLKDVQPGDAVIFDWESKKGLGKNTNTDHIGMVISVDLKAKTVTYISADTGKVIPGIVTLNTIGTLWITGFGRPVKFVPPVSVVPTIHAEQQAAHTATPTAAPTQQAE
jgi:hypothetical protein